MIHFPTQVDELHLPDHSVIRAGGSDLQERLRSTLHPPDIVDLSRIEDLKVIERDDNGTRIGATSSMTSVAYELAGAYPALALTTGALATPQIRNQGTIGGNLTQHTRCWYYRHPELSCFKSGGNSCPARSGRHLYGVAFDLGDCVHPHPSSIAMALLCYEATVTLASGAAMSVSDLLGDGTDATRDHQLPTGEIIVSINLPVAWQQEQAAYFRSISRFEAEWPLVECVARARFDGDTIAECALALGGVATVPLRMSNVEARLVGHVLDDELIDNVASLCTEGTSPLPETGYKVGLIKASVMETLQQLRTQHRSETER